MIHNDINHPKKYKSLIQLTDNCFGNLKQLQNQSYLKNTLSLLKSLGRMIQRLDTTVFHYLSQMHNHC